MVKLSWVGPIGLMLMAFKMKLLNHFMLFVFTLLLPLLLQLDTEILVLLMIWNASFVVFSWWLVSVFSLLQVVFLLTLFKTQILKITKLPKKKRFLIKFLQITKLLLIYIMNLWMPLNLILQIILMRLTIFFKVSQLNWKMKQVAKFIKENSPK